MYPMRQDRGKNCVQLRHSVLDVTNEHSSPLTCGPVTLGDRDRMGLLSDGLHDRAKSPGGLDLCPIQRSQLECCPRLVVVDHDTRVHDHGRVNAADATLAEGCVGSSESKLQRRGIRHPPLNRSLGDSERRRDLGGRGPQRYLPVAPRTRRQAGCLQLDQFDERGVKGRLVRLQPRDLCLRVLQAADQTSHHRELWCGWVGRGQIVDVSECHTDILSLPSDIRTSPGSNPPPHLRARPRDP